MPVRGDRVLPDGRRKGEPVPLAVHLAFPVTAAGVVAGHAVGEHHPNWTDQPAPWPGRAIDQLSEPIESEQTAAQGVIHAPSEPGDVDDAAQIENSALDARDRNAVMAAPIPGRK